MAQPVATDPGMERRRMRVTGTVQGVGFRPFVYRHATALGLTGSVCNDSAGVLIEAEGPPARIGELARLLVDEPPPLARVEHVEATAIAPRGDEAAFSIVESHEEGAPAVPVSVDTATCPDCVAEVGDPGNRRHRYPFTNCTNCGPRYTIVISVPYDRPATTMAGFTMCDACRDEYDDPGDRRFHAQPNACPECGPRLQFCSPSGSPLAHGDDALAAAAARLREGSMLAVKGIGGFHLAVDASDEAAVAELRRRKERDDKPFAVMVRDPDHAAILCDLDSAAVTALTSIRRPIVLAPRRDDAPVASGVAPGLPELGLMLPYTPLHHLLMAGTGRPLVMTSGNRSDEPIAYEDDDVFARLGPLVDGVLTHDRPIHIRCDDSVVRATPRRVQMLRRSRGFAPEPLALVVPARRQVLAVGAELKSTIAVAKGRAIVASHHLGDLEHLAAYRSFVQALDHVRDLFGVEPEVVAHDLHPEYLSTKLAVELDLPAWGVQHHHAHVASCLAEHGHPGPVLGVAFDGLGYGTDGSLWGGEFLVADLGGFERVGHLRPVALPGGSAAIREPWRMGLAWARLAVGRERAAALSAGFDDRADAVLELAERDDAIMTTAAGRLFDAVAALAGVRSRASYEGQAAIELEAQARRVARSDAPRYPAEFGREGRTAVLDPAGLVTAVIDECERGTDLPLVAAGFHEGLGRATADLAAALAREHDLDTVVLSGGVFQNARLTEVVEDALATEGLRVLVHERVPPNDGGISIGQAAVAATAERPPVPGS